MIGSYGELTGSQIDLLCEIGNIGAGNAATSLSVLINEGVHIGIPQVMLLDYQNAIGVIGDPEALGVAIMVRYIGDVRGVILFMVGHEDAKAIAGMLTDGFEEESVAEAFSEMKISTIKEIGNILGSAYLNSIATLTGLEIDISVPYVSIDMIGAIMSAPMVEFSVDSDNLLLIEESFSTDTRSLKSHVILFADVPSLNKILDKLGVNG